MKKNAGKILIFLLFLAGFSLLLYPLVANEWNTYRQSRLISDYDQTVAELEASGELDYAVEKEMADSYNKALLPSILPDSFADAAASGEDATYMNCLNITGTGVMGTVEIPKINIKIPIYHTTSEEVLAIAAGHLEGSSLPVGGEDTHAVISAHRGLPSAALFTDLDKMEETDHFLVHVLNDTLCYEVDKISVVEPEQTDALSVEDGMDLVTLLTCTPYGVNSHRLLVRGHRVPYEPEALLDEKIPLSNMSLHTNYLLWVVVGVAITVLFSLLLYMRERRLLARAAAASSRAGTAERVLALRGRKGKATAALAQAETAKESPNPQDMGTEDPPYEDAGAESQELKEWQEGKPDNEQPDPESQLEDTAEAEQPPEEEETC